MARKRSNKLLVPGAKNILDQFKEEIASEFGVTLGRDTSARENGAVGGEMTKRLIAEAQANRVNNSKQNNS